MDYEERILKRRKENQEFLQELGILNSNSVRSATVFHVRPKAKKHSTSSNRQPTRRSNRIKNIEPASYDKNSLDEFEECTDQDLSKTVKREKIKRENAFGAIPGISVGTHFASRLEASAAGVHRPTVAGIHGNPSFGCYSLALSGGYEDDVDLGDSFVYTGEGGRDLKGTKANPKNLRTAPQSKDQVLERGNLALSRNIENKVPVRVLRGYKLRSKYAPPEGYRYDGLYDVVEYYIAKGLSGFNVFKFRLERIGNQEPAPWSDDFIKNENFEKVNGTKDEHKIGS